MTENERKKQNKVGANETINSRHANSREAQASHFQFLTNKKLNDRSEKEKKCICFGLGEKM